MGSRIIKGKPNQSEDGLGKGIIKCRDIPSMFIGIQSKALFFVCAMGSFSATQAGVEIEKTVRRHALQGTKVTLETLVMDDHRQKIASRDHSLMLDAVAGKIYSVNHAARTYSEEDIQQNSEQQSSVLPVNSLPKVKSLGNFRTYAGYRCQMYESIIDTPQGSQVTQACFADAVPGADDYRNLMEALKRVGGDPINQGLGGGFPSGLPLYSKTTLTLNYQPPKELSKDQAKRFKRLVAAQPPRITEEIVTRIRVLTLPQSAFEIPKNYVQLRVSAPIKD